MSVDLEEDYGDISLVGWTEEKNVEMKYTVEASPFPGGSDSDAAQSKNLGSLAMWMAVLMSVITAMLVY
jgi:hypothetical protein